MIDIDRLTAEYNKNKDSVIEMLVSNCMKVDVEVPRVVKGDFENTEDA